MSLFAIIEQVDLVTRVRQEDRFLQWCWEDIIRATIKSRIRHRVNVHRWNSEKFEFEKKKLEFEGRSGIMDLFIDSIKEWATAKVTKIPLIGCKKCLVKKRSSSTTLLGNEIVTLRQVVEFLEKETNMENKQNDKDAPLIQL